MTEAVKRIATGIFFPVALLLLWHFTVVFGFVPATIFPTPGQATAAFMRLLLDGALTGHAIASLLRLGLGYVCGLGLGLAVGTLVGVSRTAQLALFPTLRLLAPIPPIAFIPVFIALFGIENGSKIALIGTGTFFVAFSAAFAGIRSVDESFVEVARLYRKSHPSLFWQVLAPHALSSVIASARIGLGLSWVLLIAAEVISSADGLGWLIWDSRNFGRVDDMVAAMLAVGVFGYLSDLMVQQLGRRLLSWRSDFGGL